MVLLVVGDFSVILSISHLKEIDTCSMFLTILHSKWPKLMSFGHFECESVKLLLLNDVKSYAVT